MNTAEFNWLDKLIAQLRLAKVLAYVRRDDVILDFGCGVQHYLLSQTKRIFQRGYGIDYDIENSQKDNIILLRQRYQDKLPFEQNFFDKVFMLAVLEHIQKDRVNILFQELSRVLKADGSIILTTPTPQGQKVLEFLSFKLKIISAQEIADHKHYYTQVELSAIAAANGLRVQAYKFFQFGLNSLCVLGKNKNV